MKNHDKFLSTFPCNLEKRCVKIYYFPAFPSSLSAGKFVTCGFWGCHLWSLTLSFAASEPLICHKWEPQSIALTAQKHRFWGSIKCKENGSCWLSTTSENVDFWPFSHQNLSQFKKQAAIWAWNSEFIWQIQPAHVANETSAEAEQKGFTNNSKKMQERRDSKYDYMKNLTHG